MLVVKAAAGDFQGHRRGLIPISILGRVNDGQIPAAPGTSGGLPAGGVGIAIPALQIQGPPRMKQIGTIRLRHTTPHVPHALPRLTVN
jgi:hypothetical protein